MEFIYEKSNDLFNLGAGFTANTGNYTGPEEISVNVDDNNNISEEGRAVTLLSSNPNHIILMDMLNGSNGFEVRDESTATFEQIGPYINHKKFDSYPTLVEYDIDKCNISNENVVTYIHSDYPITVDEIIVNAGRSLQEFSECFDRTGSTSMKTIYSKLISICEWIINDWTRDISKAHKIVIPTIDTVDDFNDIN